MTAKVLAVLDAFTPAAPELTLGEIARFARISKPTAHRRVAELIEWGALEKGDGGRIRIGIHLWEVAALAPQAMPLRELALPCLEDLMALTSGNSQLAVREGTDALFIERLRGRNGIPALTSAANRLPLSSAGVGLALLAFAPEEVQEEVLNTPIEPVTEFTMTDPERLRHVLAEVRRAGYAMSDRQLDVNAISVGAPIFDASGTVRAAIGVVYDNAKIDVNHVAHVVLTFARALSRILGAPINGAGRHP